MSGARRENWGSEDPGGRNDAGFFAVMTQIQEKILDLKRRLEAGELQSAWHTQCPALLNRQRRRAFLLFGVAGLPGQDRPARPRCVRWKAAF